MHGVTTAIVAFLFAGVIWPHLVKHKVQFYAALIIVVAIILLDSIAHLFTAPPKAIYAVNGLLQVGALVLSILSTGMSFRELGGEVFQTIDVVRRGGEKETIIVPLRGEQPKPRRARDTGPAPSADALQLNPHRDIAAEEAALDAEEQARAAAAAAAPDAAASAASLAVGDPLPPPTPAPPAAPRPAPDRGSIPLEP